MTQTWHADEETLRAWADGTAAPVPAASHRGPPAPLRRVPSADGHARAVRLRQRRRTTLGRAGRPDRPAARQPAAASRPGHPGLRTAWLASVLLLLTLPVVVSVLDAPPARSSWRWHRSPRSRRWPSPTDVNAEPAGELALRHPDGRPARGGGAGRAGRPLGRARRRRRGPAARAARLGGARLAAAGRRPWPHWWSWPARPGWTPRSSLRPWARSGSSPSRGPPPRAAVPADVVTHLVASAPSQLAALAVALAAIALTLARRDTVAYRRTA